jgi:hypothetical protein
MDDPALMTHLADRRPRMAESWRSPGDVVMIAPARSLTGAAIVLLDARIRPLGSTIDPFATGIASGFAGILDRAIWPDRRLIILMADSGSASSSCCVRTWTG